MPADPERHLRAERTHLRAAQSHGSAAAFWTRHGDAARAADESDKDEQDRAGAAIERERYRLETGRQSDLVQPQELLDPHDRGRSLRAESEQLRDRSRRLRAEGRAAYKRSTPRNP
jgi:hypothetical protein